MQKNKKKIIVGNWKMNPATSKEAEKLFTNIVKLLPSLKKTEVVVCAPYIYLEKLKKISKKISLGAQNANAFDAGALTGEVSAEMLENIGVKYVILGHSERRAMGEENSDITKKVKSALSSGLVPIICIGERGRDESHEYLNFVKTQIEECSDEISKNMIGEIVIAYEPVWAVGKGAQREATAEEFREMSVFIKKILSDKFGVKMVEGMRIIYGGSVHPQNVLEFLGDGGADGMLVGRDSLDSHKFAEIVKITESFNK